MYGEALEKYLNQEASWEKRTGADGYNKPVFAPVETIKARVEGKIRVVRAGDGKEAASDTTVFCREAVSALDKINGREVLAVTHMVDGTGVVAGYEVYL